MNRSPDYSSVAARPTTLPTGLHSRTPKRSRKCSRENPRQINDLPSTTTLLHFHKEKSSRGKTGHKGTIPTVRTAHIERKEDFPESDVVRVVAVTATQDPLFDPPPAHKLEKHSKPTPDGMPDWLKKHLEEKTGGFRAARWTRCPRCQAIILKGLDDDVAAWTVEVDPTPLTPRQEELCQWIGRQTYMVTMNPNRIELDRRSRYAIGKPCERPIVPAHRCGKRSPGFLLPHDASTHEQDANDLPSF